MKFEELKKLRKDDLVAWESPTNSTKYSIVQEGPERTTGFVGVSDKWTGFHIIDAASMKHFKNLRKATLQEVVEKANHLSDITAWAKHHISGLKQLFTEKKGR